MKVPFISVLMTLLIMVFIDAFWLALMYKRLYAPHIGHLLSESIKLGPALFFYILYAFSLYVLVIVPELKHNEGVWHLLLMGMLFGLVTYGTYDLTNQATLKNWPSIVTFADMVWGALLTGAVSVISTTLIRRFF